MKNNFNDFSRITYDTINPNNELTKKLVDLYNSAYENETKEVDLKLSFAELSRIITSVITMDIHTDLSQTSIRNSLNFRKKKNEEQIKKEQRAKEISIEVWEYFRDHPESRDKNWLPEELKKKVKDELNDCPLCTLFHDGERGRNCEKCPLEHCERLHESFYFMWRTSETSEKISKYAGLIVDKIKAWRI